MWYLLEYLDREQGLDMKSRAEQCGFNILVMRALGLMNLSDEVPVASTYYLFKQSLYAYGLQGVAI